MPRHICRYAEVSSDWSVSSEYSQHNIVGAVTGAMMSEQREPGPAGSLPIQRSKVVQTFTVPEVAQILRVPKLHVYRLVREGKLPAVHIGRWVRVPEEALRAWMAQGGTSVRQAQVSGAQNHTAVVAARG